MQRNHTRSRSRSAMIGLTAVAALTLPVSAVELLDDFADGDDVGWTRFTLPDGLPGATWDVTDDFVYRLWVSDTKQRTPQGSIVASFLDITDGYLRFSNGYWRATVVRETENSTTHLFMRGELAAVDAYGFGWYSDNGLVIQRVYGGASTLLANDPEFVQEVDTEYILEAGAIGPNLEIRMWPVDEDRPELPQLATTDSYYSSGANGIVAQADFDGDLSATFDDVKFAPACPADVTSDGTVDVLDLLKLLAAWGTSDLAADINDDGTVDVLDLLALLSAWGPCS